MNFWEKLRQTFTSTAEGVPTELAEPCFWQVDMHSHLVPGIDDGVSSPEQSLECLQQFAAWGIRKVITTPHVSRDWFPNSSATLRQGLHTLQALVDEHQLPLTIEVAAEYMLDEFFPDLLETDDLLTFGPERYVLIETGWASAPQQLDDLLFRMKTRGYTPVLAHPERYAYFFEHQDALTHLHETGCLFQLNWPSLTGRYGDRVLTQARWLLKRGWVDFIGSDLHRPSSLTALATLFASADYQLLQKQPLLNQSLLKETV
ncbi:histidinol-phosphatase [Fibrisoma montanum]|uniref:protein-tyrosine-phosphatase n=1 Tax=Fibrisoma montanum TaxID=2305895 RepID=A0A418MAQ9_9BACT|nr:CpsB/CapC family capsule biosynthesis tyrosine phosphatase [Fibrisoma montanum]RIV23430.1 histidinol-phosphatase [Fibrisoma montanum]